MIISEIFYSIQGEGLLSGFPSVFIRTSGCNLRCRWCDTPYASWNPEGEEMTIETIVRQTQTFPANYVVITGGEPMIAGDIKELTARLSQIGKHITIETAGTVLPDNIICDLASISPKLSNSDPVENISENWKKRHLRDRFNKNIITEWLINYNFQLKFVVQNENDIDEIGKTTQSLGLNIPSEKIMLMPEGVTSEALSEKNDMIVAACLKFGYSYCPRLHIDLFGNKKGT